MPVPVSAGPVKFLALQCNAAVVQVPGRRFPGVVIQGDTLRSWYGLAEMIAREKSPEEALGMLDELRETLRDYVDFYAEVLTAHGLELPFPPVEPRAVCERDDDL